MTYLSGPSLYAVALEAYPKLYLIDRLSELHGTLKQGLAGDIMATHKHVLRFFKNIICLSSNGYEFGSRALYLIMKPKILSE